MEGVTEHQTPENAVHFNRTLLTTRTAFIKI